MKYTLYIAAFSLCLLSFCAYQYLSSMRQALMNEPSTSEQAELEETPPKYKERRVLLKGKKTRLIIIEEPIPSEDSTKKVIKKERQPKKEATNSVLPDVEFLKFVIQKSKDGMPVLSVGSNHFDKLGGLLFRMIR